MRKKGDLFVKSRDIKRVLKLTAKLITLIAEVRVGSQEIHV